MEHAYTEESIQSLDWREHIRRRPGMYIGKLGDGAAPDDGLYVLVKEVIDNAIDEFVMGYGQRIEVSLDERMLTVRDYGRGIPLGKLREVTSKINTGAKYDSEVFKKSVGLNGVGIKAVNALSGHFSVEAYREGKMRAVVYEQGNLVSEDKRDKATTEKNGTCLSFEADEAMFGEKYAFRMEHLEKMLWNYAYLNTGLTLTLNGKKYRSENGLRDLLEERLSDEPLYPIIHLKGDDIEVAFTHGASQYGEEYYSFVNGQHTTMGGTHQAAFREGLVNTVRGFFKNQFEASDIRSGLIAAVAVKVEEPVFESQTKTKLGSTDMGPDGPTIRTFVGNFLGNELDKHLHREPDTAKALREKILQSERERKELKGIQKIARERAKKAKIHNRKLRDCRAHFDSSHRRREESTLFITEGDSASGSLTKSREVETQAVFSLKGKPLNCFGKSKKICYENEEFNLLQHALNIEDGLDDLRYNKVVLATDADVDGMHIRLLLLTFFLQYFPELVKAGHLYILQTPLFRVRNKKETLYCYSEAEKAAAIERLGKSAEITRFKGLGEISPGEFARFIGPDIRLDPVIIPSSHDASDFASLKDLLTFYMGPNTPERQKFMVENLRVEIDPVHEEQVREAEEAEVKAEPAIAV